MDLSDDNVRSYIGYFFSKIVGFKSQEFKYTSMNQSNNEFLSIAMDKVDRLERKKGKLRARIWSNCYFIFHNSDIEPAKVYKEKVAEIKKLYPFLFIRSYIYFIFIDISKRKQLNILDNSLEKIETKYYKIWIFNSKYEVQEETRRSNIFGITLDEKEVVDDYMYLTNPESELQRIKSTNSDAIDCVRAFTGDLQLLEQTSKVLDAVRTELEENHEARVILEGPARSGKTIIAAILLGQYENSKFLLMNYFFYQAIVDGFHALSGWSTEQIEELVKNPELDLWVNLNKKMPRLLESISKNLGYAIQECGRPKNESKTKQWLTENIAKLTDGLDQINLEGKGLYIIKSLMSLNSRLADASNVNSFADIDVRNLKKLKYRIDEILSGDLVCLQNVVVKTIEELIINSKQKFFHHNINKKISSKLKDGCWIERGNITISKMWSKDYQPKLIICDEVQRLGIIPSFGNYDEFDEVDQILSHSEQSFFTGDDFQMLNSKYDQGIEKINDVILKRKQSLRKFVLPESVGVPAEIGLLMKYLTNPQAVTIYEVVRNWEKERNFEIIFIENDANRLVKYFDEDSSNKKHIASPIDYTWLKYNEKIEIDTLHRENPIITLQAHDKENFAFKFPYFCNEEIMPNYILSAYELISREVESLYVHVPKFEKRSDEHIYWFRKHLYVLFTRPTSKLIVNFDVKEEFDQVNRLVILLRENGAKVSVIFLAKA